MYTIVEKVECIEGKLIYTPVGFITEHGMPLVINYRYEISMGKWIKENYGSLTYGYDSLTYKNQYNLFGRDVYIAKHEIIGQPSIGSWSISGFWTDDPYRIDKMVEITSLEQLYGVDC